MSRGVVALALFLAGCGGDDRDARRARVGTDAPIARRMTVADAAAGGRAFGRCAQCHTIREGGPDLAGPNLHGVFGEPIASNRAAFGYTDALRSTSGRWDEATLDRWLADPRATVPGTSMAFPGIADPIERADIIAYIRDRR